ncbi:MAG: glycosyltransferase family 39 protein, partial [Rivularia sp. (in: cyanobacteria)]
MERSLVAAISQLSNNLMMTNRKLNLHYLSLTFFISLAIILRFWNLEFKPLWMDEVITAIFSLGKNYSSIPLDVVFPLEQLRDVFTYQPGVSCPQIAQNIATESTHPPLFFCGMYALLGWVAPLGDDWVNKLRSPSAWFGVALVVAVYFLNRLAFSRKAGLMGAAFVAVSPFAVYLSQEARHYTLPMLTISLSLLALIQIQQDIFQRQQVKIRVWLWLTWTIINIISIYIHYFCIIALIAQIATLLLLIFLPRLSRNKKIKLLSLQKINLHSSKSLRNCFIALILSISTVAIALIPWLRIVQNHLNRSETSWLPTPQHIEPLYQTLISWVVMIIMLPVEGQPLAITIISALLMLLFAAWLGWKVFRGIKLLLKEPTTCLPTLTLLSFTTFVLIGIFTISYILGKDITVAPRYNFIYYPSFSALIAASLIRENIRDESILFSEDGNILLSEDKNILLSEGNSSEQDARTTNVRGNSSEQDARTTNVRGNSSEQDARTTNLKKSNIFNLKIKNHQLPIILLVGLIGCIFVVSNLGLQKPYLPQQVAQKIYQEPTVPVMAVMAYSNYQDVALGLSYA